VTTTLLIVVARGFQKFSQTSIRLDAADTCSESNDALYIHIGPHRGTYPASWKQIHAEVYGSNTTSAGFEENQQPIELNRSTQSLAFTINDTGKGIDLDLK
jgi:alpha-glucosidase